MQISDVMTKQVISVRQNETAEMAARLLSRNNIGAMPVCDDSGAVVGMVTDRDLVTRCMAAGLKPRETPVAQVMTSGPVTVRRRSPPRRSQPLWGAARSGGFRCCRTAR